LSYEEFDKGMTEYGAKLSADEAKELFLSFDKDGTGNIDFDELLIAVRVTFVFVFFNNVLLIAKKLILKSNCANL